MRKCLCMEDSNVARSRNAASVIPWHHAMQARLGAYCRSGGKTAFPLDSSAA
jgi:hypothetical protein